MKQKSRHTLSDGDSFAGLPTNAVQKVDAWSHYILGCHKVNVSSSGVGRQVPANAAPVIIQSQCLMM